jgi:hypothetical protein
LEYYGEARAPKEGNVYSNEICRLHGVSICLGSGLCGDSCTSSKTYVYLYIIYTCRPEPALARGVGW